MEIGHSILFKDKIEIPQLGGKGDEEYQKYIPPTYYKPDGSNYELVKQILELTVFKTKPCPFCGEQPYTMISQINDSLCDTRPPRIQAEVACATCDVSKYNSIMWKEANFLNILNLMAKTIEDWNTRK